MAWQTPKTNWTAADGVRNTDLNRIEDNILTLYKESIHTATTVYVNASTGNDSTGTGLAGAPFKTITKALNSLPKNLNGFGPSIQIAAGTYSEAVQVWDYIGGTVTLTGASGAAVNITGLDIRNSNVLVTSINLAVGSGGIYIGSAGMLYCASGSIAVNSAAEAVTLRYGAILEVTTTLTINNSSNRGLQVQYASTASVANLAGSGNSIGIYAYHSTVFVRNMTMTAVTGTINENSIYNIGGAVG